MLFLALLGVAVILPTVLLFRMISQGRRLKNLEHKFERYVKEKSTEKALKAKA